jgi:hypothetical protein
MLKSEIRDGFSLTFLSEGEAKGEFTGRFLAAALLFLGLYGCLWRALDLAGTGANPLLLGTAGLLYCAASCGLPKKSNVFYFVSLIVLAVYVLIISRYVIEGWNITGNQIFMTFENHLGRIFPRYEVGEAVVRALAANLFLILPTILLAALCGRASATGGVWLFIAVLPAIALGAAALVFRVDAPVVWAAVLAAAIALLAGRLLTLHNRIPDAGRMVLWLLVLVACVTVIAALLPLAVGGAGEKAAGAARLDAERQIHKVRYGETRQTLPEGDFAKIGGFVDRVFEGFMQGDEQVDLEISVDSPGNYYLRSFVGEVYGGSGWTVLPPERRAEYATLFSWLHGRGFYAQNQYALLADALGADGQTAEMTVRNVGACPAYLYTPYEVLAEAPDKNRIGDENLPAAGLRGQEEYAFSVVDGSVADHEWQYVALVDARQQNDPAALAYLESENAYRDFVYENYLEMTPEARATVERFLAGLELPDGAISFADAQMIVNTYLKSVSFTDLPQESFRGDDLLRFFLEESRQGDSIHFATAGVMIFRYLGVPARYVEGYRLTESMAPAAGSAGAIVLNGRDAEAWAEIYRDGVGFVPFEPAAMTALPPPEEEQEIIEEPPIDPEVPPQDLQEMLSQIGKVAAILLLAALVCILILEIRRAVKRRRFLALLDAAGNAEAVIRMTNRLLWLLGLMGIVRGNGSLRLLRAPIERKLGAGAGGEFETVVCVQQAALFSGREASAEDRAQVQAFLDRMPAELKARAGFFRKLRLRWIDGAL